MRMTPVEACAKPKRAPHEIDVGGMVQTAGIATSLCLGGAFGYFKQFLEGAFDA